MVVASNVPPQTSHTCQRTCFGILGSSPAGQLITDDNQVRIAPVLSGKHIVEHP